MDSYFSFFFYYFFSLTQLFVNSSKLGLNLWVEIARSTHNPVINRVNNSQRVGLDVIGKIAFFIFTAKDLASFFQADETCLSFFFSVGHRWFLLFLVIWRIFLLFFVVIRQMFEPNRPYLVFKLLSIKFESCHKNLSFSQCLKILIFANISCDHHKQTIGTNATFEIGTKSPLRKDVLKSKGNHRNLRVSRSPLSHKFSRVSPKTILIL